MWYEDGFRGLTMEDKERTAGINYEAEYKRICELYHSLTMKCEAIRADYENMKSLYEKATAQLEIVRLIFGGRC